MTLKLQPHEKRFLEALRNNISITDGDVSMLFRIWRRKFGDRPDAATAIRMPAKFLYPAEFFKQSSYSPIFIQNGKYYKSWEKMDYQKPFLYLISSCFTSHHDARVYLLYGYTPESNS